MPENVYIVTSTRFMCLPMAHRGYTDSTGDADTPASGEPHWRPGWKLSGPGIRRNGVHGSNGIIALGEGGRQALQRQADALNAAHAHGRAAERESRRAGRRKGKNTGVKGPAIDVNCHLPTTQWELPTGR